MAIRSAFFLRTRTNSLRVAFRRMYFDGCKWWQGNKSVRGAIQVVLRMRVFRWWLQVNKLKETHTKAHLPVYRIVLLAFICNRAIEQAGKQASKRKSTCLWIVDELRCSLHMRDSLWPQVSFSAFLRPYFSSYRFEQFSGRVGAPIQV